ncbi:Bzip transcription factor [Phytophthora megakarya]|uniref:Bzip transcription factor n=1 Tax=Phytophthora megakarya TaxID=4795 RepID=A0A225UMI4_9STRA|nr:Bzip transcription factor [Phytophthora megakarya]
MTENSSVASPKLEPKTTPALTEKQAIRREQCRANQARYRNKQINRRRELQQQIQLLEEEIQGLKLKRRSIRFERKTNQSPWTVIGEVFRLIEDGFRSPWRLANMEEMMKHAETRQSLEFLQKSFVHNVAMGELQGVNALMDQWRRYSLYFEDPHIELSRVETVTTNVVTAVATLSATINEFTLRCVLPHLANPKGVKGKVASLHKQLVGQRIDCKCSIRFLFDDDSGRVVRLESKIDLISPLLRILKNIKDVSTVLGPALLTSECLIGDLSGRSM